MTCSGRSSTRRSPTKWSPRSGTTGTTRPRIAGASSSNRRSTGWRRCRGSRVGVELSSVPAGAGRGLAQARPGLEIVDIGPLIRPLRRSKDADEIATLRRSMRAGEAAQAAALAADPAGDDRAGRLPDRPERGRRSAGRTGDRLWRLRVRPPVRNASKGGPPTSRKIEPGDLLLLDFSVVVVGLPRRLHQHVRRRRRADGPPARAVRGMRRAP